MGFSCCKCSGNALFKSTIVDIINQNEKPIENRNINEGINYDNDSINFIEKTKYPTQRTSDKYKKHNNSFRKSKLPDSRNEINNVNVLYGEEGIIDSLIRIRDK